MQQTTKYKLDLIEMGDKFLPDPLNQNMEKVEAALAGEEAARAAETAALDARVTALEVKKLLFGSYTGNAKKTGDSQFIPLPFTPVALIVHGEANTQFARLENQDTEVQIKENGFTVTANFGCTMNREMTVYNFLAFA